MNIHCEPSINDNKISSVITITEFGNQTLTPEEEIEMLVNYPTTLEYKTLVFKKKLNVDVNGKIIEDETTGEELEVKLINKKILVDKDFKAEFGIALKDIDTTSLKTIFNTKVKYAQGLNKCFELVVTEALETIITGIRSQSNDFEVYTDKLI